MDIGKGGLAIPEISAFSIQRISPSFELRHDRSSEELPAAPPNTARHSGQSSTMHSQPQTPGGGDEDEDDRPIELNVSAFLTKPISIQPTRTPSPICHDLFSPPDQRRSSLPASPSISRKPSGLGADEMAFRFHRDSVEITQGHLKKRQEVEGKVNQQLLNSHRDSFIITKSKLESKLPKSGPPNAQSWNLSGGLSPIMDASPPNSIGKAAKSVKVAPPPEKVTGQMVGNLYTEYPHPDEHKNCPIYEVERPR